MEKTQHAPCNKLIHESVSVRVHNYLYLMAALSSSRMVLTSFISGVFVGGFVSVKMFACSHTPDEWLAIENARNIRNYCHENRHMAPYVYFHEEYSQHTITDN